jgi:drug/metabolite transporter (DMT)-like permease
MKISILQHTHMGKNFKLVKIITAFAVIYLVWGSTYLAIRLAINTLPPFLMAGLRFTSAGLLLYSWCYWRHDVKPKLADWKKSAPAGILMMFLGNGTVTWSEQFIPSGFVALVVATMPIWMVILDWMKSNGEKPAKLTIIGIFLGLGGVALLSGLDKSLFNNQLKDIGSVIPYIIILTLAAISWAMGSLYSRNMKTSVSLQFTVSMQLIVGGMTLLLFGLLQGEWDRLDITQISLPSLSALIYLIIFGTMLAYSAYVWLLRTSTPAKVGTYAFFNPLVAIFLGWLWVDEPLTMQTILGASCILISILLVNKAKFDKRSSDILKNDKTLNHIENGGTQHDCQNLAGSCPGCKV